MMDRVMAFSERCHKYCFLLCIVEGLVFSGLLIWTWTT